MADSPTRRVAEEARAGVEELGRSVAGLEASMSSMMDAKMETMMESFKATMSQVLATREFGGAGAAAGNPRGGGAEDEDEDTEGSDRHPPQALRSPGRSQREAPVRAETVGPRQGHSGGAGAALPTSWPPAVNAGGPGAGGMGISSATAGAHDGADPFTNHHMHAQRVTPPSFKKGYSFIRFKADFLQAAKSIRLDDFYVGERLDIPIADPLVTWSGLLRDGHEQPWPESGWQHEF